MKIIIYSPSLIDSQSSLGMADHFEVTELLENLDKKDVIKLGTALGLSYIKLKKMETFPEDMVAVWLRGDDDVNEKSGSPSWESLATALDKTRHTDIASKARKVSMEGEVERHYLILLFQLQKKSHCTARNEPPRKKMKTDHI